MSEPVFRSRGEGEEVGHPLGGYVTFKARGGETNGRVTAFETIVGPNEGPPLHRHANEDETLYVLEGEFRFKLGDDLHPAPPGSFVFVPQGATHSFQNVGETQGRMLIHFTPSGMERFFEEFAALPAPDPGAFAEVAQVVQMEVMGPPLARSDPT